ncbi:biopolymer transporter ExbD [Aquabacterium sp. G14]|uniref:ExbD/TolR family protein n=1 Tax=Aquabacterium sp. G14 TaxID=3130164 RepID=UPI0030AA987D
MAFGSFDRSSTGAPSAEINMVPLIDVMLVLLVIFIVAAPMLTHSVPLQLPQASASPTRTETPHVSVSITAEARVYWQGEALSREHWQARMQTIAAQQPDTELRVQADRAVSYGTVATVLADANRAGLHRVAFVSTPDAP